MAAAAAAALKALDKIHTNAVRHYEIMSSIVQPLTTDFRIFDSQLRRMAYNFSWHASILNTTTPEVVPPNDVTEHPYVKHLHDIKNAYMIIMDKTENHPVAHILSTCAPGDGRTAYHTVYSYFYRSTTSGRITSMNQFFGSTMANTDANITEWISETRRKASVVINTGGQADDVTQLTVLLGGLLPQFDNIRLPLQRDATMTFPNAIPLLMDFAHSENLLTTTKTGSKRGNNAFALDAKPAAPACRRWKRGACTYGDRCKYSHTGNGGLASAAECAAFHEEKKKLQPTPPPRAPKNTPPVAHFATTDADFDDEDEADYSNFSHVFGLDAPLTTPRSVASLGPPAITQPELALSPPELAPPPLPGTNWLLLISSRHFFSSASFSPWTLGLLVAWDCS